MNNPDNQKEHSEAGNESNHVSENRSENRPETEVEKEPANTTSPNDSRANSAEHGGPKGLEPTRYGDWERNGRCTDF